MASASAGEWSMAKLLESTVTKLGQTTSNCGVKISKSALGFIQQKGIPGSLTHCNMTHSVRRINLLVQNFIIKLHIFY